MDADVGGVYRCRNQQGEWDALREGAVVLFRSGSVLAVCALLMVGCGSESSSTEASTTVLTEPPVDTAVDTLPTTTEPSSVPPTLSTIEPVAIEDAGGVRFDVDGGPDWVTLADGFVFSYTAGVGRFDAVTGELLSTTDIGGAPICLAMDAGFESVWVGLCGTPTLLRIDPATGDVLATIPLPVSDLHEESSLAAGEGGVFLVARSENQIVKVDPSTNAVATVLDVPQGATAVRAGFGSLWVTARASDVLHRLDPSTGEVIATVKVGAGPRFLAVGDEGVWVMNQDDGSVSRVDPETNTVIATVQVNPGRIVGGDIAVGGGSAWVRTTNHLLVRVDAATNQVTQFYDPASGSGGVAADGEAVWLSAHDVNSMWRLPLG